MNLIHINVIFYQLTGNYVVSIFLFTLVFRLIMLPFSIKQQKSSAKMARDSLSQDSGQIERIHGLQGATNAIGAAYPASTGNSASGIIAR